MSSTNDFLGLSKKAAQNLAEQRNLIFRLIRIDGESFNQYPTQLDPPEEARTDRVCAEIDDGKVTKVTVE